MLEPPKRTIAFAGPQKNTTVFPATVFGPGVHAARAVAPNAVTATTSVTLTPPATTAQPNRRTIRGPTTCASRHSHPALTRAPQGDLTNAQSFTVLRDPVNTTTW